MNPFASLRVEFAIPGAGTIVAIIWLVSSVAYRFHNGTQRRSPFRRAFTSFEHASSQTPSAVQAVALIVVAIGAAYIVGVIAVMATYIWPTSQVISNVRLRKIKDFSNALVDLDLLELTYAQRLIRDNFGEFADELVARSDGSAGLGPKTRASWFRKDSRWWRVVFTRKPANASRHGRLADYGRIVASSAVADEYEYRRSTRQLTAGVLPALTIATLVGVTTDWRHWGITGPAQILPYAVWILVGIGAFIALLSSVIYQETVGQAQLINSAFFDLASAPLKVASDVKPDERSLTRKWRSHIKRD